jgi:multidrug resistance efflux pump
MPKSIAMPPWVFWREFRSRYLPAIVLVITGLAIFFLWRQVDGAVLAGVGEGVRFFVTSPQSGWITTLMVRPYQTVRKGEPLAIIQPLDVRAQLDLLRSELEIARLRSQPSIPEQNAMNYEQVRVDWLRQRSELALARVNLERAEKELRRSEPLYREKLISADIYDLAVRDRDLYLAEVEEKSNAVVEIELRLQTLRPLGDPQLANTNGNVLSGQALASFTWKQALAQTNWDSITLTAPMDGMVYGINRQAGGFVLDGELLMDISSLRSDRVVGYLRQPYAFDPQVGTRVKVVTRTHQRHQFTSQITQVGAQLEYITNALAYLRPMALVDMGLPIVIDVPREFQLRPGEVVDILVVPD